MTIESLDVTKLSKLISQQVEYVTCVECCKYYINPLTTSCGHTLCQACWRGRRTCPTCSKSVDKKALKPNLPIRELTEHVNIMGEAFENLFNVKLDELPLEAPEKTMAQGKDLNTNVIHWLADSQNQFSAPQTDSQQSTQDFLLPSVQKQKTQPIEVTTSKVLIHSNTKVITSPTKIVHKPRPQQDDWDKIEELPDTEEADVIKNKQNVIGPMDFEPFFIDENDYTAGNPRRSSRNRDTKSNNCYDDPEQVDDVADKTSSKNSAAGTERSNTVKQNWNNVTRMRKKFSKLNKNNRNKLNVSIEMCKIAQNSLNKQKDTPEKDIPLSLAIDDNTPNICDKKALDTVNCSNKTLDSNKENINLTNKHISNVTHNFQNNLIKDGHIQDNNIPLSHKIAEPRRMPFIKKGYLHTAHTEKKKEGNNIKAFNITNTDSSNADDIEISIKIGSTVTNILIKKKTNDVRLQVNTDREIQTSLGPYELPNDNITCVTPNKVDQVLNIERKEKKDIVERDMVKSQPAAVADKTLSSKRNTESAATATANFEITESVEKELSKVMDIQQNMEETQKSVQHAAHNNDTKANTHNVVAELSKDMECLNDLDIFESGSTVKQSVQLLKDTKYAASEILIPTLAKSKLKTQHVTDKRNRGLDDENSMPCSKKAKIVSSNKSQLEKEQLKLTEHDSEIIQYDDVMDKVFANIDADLKDSQKSKDVSRSKQILQSSKSLTTHKQTQKTQVLFQSQNNKKDKSPVGIESDKVCNKDAMHQKYSENIFSFLDKDSEPHDIVQGVENKIPSTNTQQKIQNLLTPGMCRDLAATEVPMETEDVQIIENFGTPLQDPDDSDKSIVEETPQKNYSFSKPNSKRNSGSKHENDNEKGQYMKKMGSNNVLEVAKVTNIDNMKSVIDLSDSEMESNKTIKNTTIVDKQTLETPLTINKFVGQIKHKSTPVARKSLNFNQEDPEKIDNDDPEQTLCPTTSLVAQTTQERDFMHKAFEESPKPLLRPITHNLKNQKAMKYSLVGSCLTAVELRTLKRLCSQYGWTFLDSFSRDITHLVVSVDEENKSQRSVKYMCALAASKWIVSYEWVDQCIARNQVVDEEPFEVLDTTGVPGPRRSRLANHKLFEGITFYCMPPFSVLDNNVLEGMLEAAGGRVVREARAVKATDSKPCLLLAEPENTQEDRFIYLAMDLSIVPVNYDWALNCLGRYSLGSIFDLLLCPASLLPLAVKSWPSVLLAQDVD